MLSVYHLKRTYGDFVAAQAVSFSIAKGEIVGLLGHNGAGKTTVMKMLSGYLEPSAGEIIFERQPLAQNLKQLQKKIGYLPESLPVYPELSVAEYLDYAAELKGISKAQKPREVKRVLAATDLGAKLLAPINTLSRGFKQRVGVAQALLGNPSLLILDEPTNGLDPQQTLHMRELIRTLAQSATVILSTHIMQEVEALCDRVLMMRQGQLVIDAQLASLRQGRAILLACSTNCESVQNLLRGQPGINAIKSVNSLVKGTFNRLRIEINEGTNINALCASIAQTLCASGAQLYELRTEVRDLETLFREVNNQNIVHPSSEALNHAA